MNNSPHLALIDLEVASVWRGLARGGHLDPRRLACFYDDLRELPLQRVEYTSLLWRLWELRDNLIIYDAAYVALAEALQTPPAHRRQAPLAIQSAHAAPSRSSRPIVDVTVAAEIEDLMLRFALGGPGTAMEDPARGRAAWMTSVDREPAFSSGASTRRGDGAFPARTRRTLPGNSSKGMGYPIK